MTPRSAGRLEPLDGPAPPGQPRRALTGLAFAGLIVLGGLVLFTPHAGSPAATASPPGSVAAASLSPTPRPVVAILPVPSLDLDASSAVVAQGQVSGTATGAGIEAQVFVASIDQTGPFVVDLACAGPGSITWLAVPVDQSETATATHPCGAATHDLEAAGFGAAFDVSITADGAASWSWAVSVPAAPTPLQPPTATPGPTPACPPVEPYGSFPPPPEIALSSGGQSAVGDAWSVGLETCFGSSVSDGVPGIPLKGLKLRPTDGLTISVGDGMTLFEVSSAQYAAAAGTVAPPDQQDLAVEKTRAPGIYVVETPPAGDWVLLISVGVDDVARGAVWSETVDFRVTVTP